MPLIVRFGSPVDVRPIKRFPALTGGKQSLHVGFGRPKRREALRAAALDDAVGTLPGRQALPCLAGAQRGFQKVCCGARLGPMSRHRRRRRRLSVFLNKASVYLIGVVVVGLGLVVYWLIARAIT